MDPMGLQTAPGDVPADITGSLVKALALTSKCLKLLTQLSLGVLSQFVEPVCLPGVLQSLGQAGRWLKQKWRRTPVECN